MVMPRPLSAFSLSSTQGYLKEPLPIWGGVRSEERVDGEQPDLSQGIQPPLQDFTAHPASTLCHQTQPGADCHSQPPPLLEPTPRVGASPQLPPSQTSQWSSCQSPTLVDEVPSGGGLARVHVADDHDIDVCLLFAHCSGCFLQSLLHWSTGGEGGERAQCPQPCSRPPPTHASAGDSWTVKGKSGSVSCGVTAPFSWVLVRRDIHKIIKNRSGLLRDSSGDGYKREVYVNMEGQYEGLLCKWK